MKRKYYLNAKKQYPYRTESKRDCHSMNFFLPITNSDRDILYDRDEIEFVDFLRNSALCKWEICDSWIEAENKWGCLYLR